jgi:ATP-dependent Clp protease adaptor protein ClpS
MTQETKSMFEFEESVLLQEVTTTDISELIVYNDDFITFDWVITCFIDILGHSSEQSEQLAYIIHYTGKAAVKVGSADILQPYKEALIERGLSAVIA